MAPLLLSPSLTFSDLVSEDVCGKFSIIWTAELLPCYREGFIKLCVYARLRSVNSFNLESFRMCNNFVLFAVNDTWRRLVKLTQTKKCNLFRHMMMLTLVGELFSRLFLWFAVFIMIKSSLRLLTFMRCFSTRRRRKVVEENLSLHFSFHRATFTCYVMFKEVNWSLLSEILKRKFRLQN